MFEEKKVYSQKKKKLIWGHHFREIEEGKKSSLMYKLWQSLTSNFFYVEFYLKITFYNFLFSFHFANVIAVWLWATTTTKKVEQLNLNLCSLACKPSTLTGSRNVTLVLQESFFCLFFSFIVPDDFATFAGLCNKLDFALFVWCSCARMWLMAAIGRHHFAIVSPQRYIRKTHHLWSSSDCWSVFLFWFFGFVLWRRGMGEGGSMHWQITNSSSSRRTAMMSWMYSHRNSIHGHVWKPSHTKLQSASGIAFVRNVSHMIV